MRSGLTPLPVRKPKEQRAIMTHHYRIAHLLRPPTCRVLGAIRFSSSSTNAAAAASIPIDQHPAQVKRLFRQNLQFTAANGGSQRVAKQHARGSLTAMERVQLLFDSGTFRELDCHVKHRCTDFAMEHFAGDGVITGHGTIHGQPVYVFSQDFTVYGGALSEANAEKICKVLDMAMRTRTPVI